MSVGQVRVMLFLNQKASVYDSCAVGRRGGGAADTSPLMAPQYLDKSWYVFFFCGSSIIFVGQILYFGSVF